ncbi:MAG TPA: response regulator transcription factor [Anaerolineales bacterium]|nr:response regulator transcription factor [Anaerolineales bacterium]
MPIPKIFVVCDQTDAAPVWGYILRQQELNVILEASPDKAVEHWSKEIPDLAVIDVDVTHQDPMLLCKRLRPVSLAPILLFLPAHHETQILEAYAAGVDEVLVKPISPAIFMAKIRAWVRRRSTVPVDKLPQVRTGKHRLEPDRRCFVDENGTEIRLTNLEFRLLYLLMSRPTHLFNAEDIIQAIWGGFGSGDQVLLKNVVYRLRKKIEADPGRPTLLRTWSGGYSFEG